MDNFRYSKRVSYQVGGSICALVVLTIIQLIMFFIMNVLWVMYVFTFALVALLGILLNGVEQADKEKKKFEETDNE